MKKRNLYSIVALAAFAAMIVGCGSSDDAADSGAASATTSTPASTTPAGKETAANQETVEAGVAN